MTSTLDPLGLWGLTAGAFRTGFRVVAWTERQFVNVLDPRRAESKPSPVPARSEAVARELDVEANLNQKMSRLLGRAIAQSTSSGTAELFNHILDQLVPDEARIISALSDGSVTPLVSVHAWTRAGILGESMIENAALVGRTANLALAQLTPTYVGHLLSLGLVEVGPEAANMKDEYQILLADTDVLKAIKRGSRGPVPARVDKRVLRLSALGNALWSAAMGELNP